MSNENALSTFVIFPDAINTMEVLNSIPTQKILIRITDSELKKVEFWDNYDCKYHEVSKISYLFEGIQGPIISYKQDDIERKEYFTSTKQIRMLGEDCVIAFVKKLCLMDIFEESEEVIMKQVERMEKL